MILGKAECYNYFADEVVIVGKDWPQEFKWDYIGQYFKMALISVVLVGDENGYRLFYT